MTKADKKTIVLNWPRFGPYHLARLEATGRRFVREGWRVVGLEVARTDSVYAWDVADGADSFERVTLFEGNYHSRSRKEIARAVGDALDRIDPDAVATVGWSFIPARAALAWACRTGRTSVVLSESKRDDARRYWIKEAIKRRIVRRFDAALVGGAPHAEYAAELGIPDDRIFLGHNAVDNDYFAAGAAEARRNRDALRAEFGLPKRFFLCIGRFVPVKNLDRLLDAYAAYRRASSAPWPLVLCGGGELEAELREQADRLGLEGLIWPGFIQYPHLPNYYGLASAFILPSVKDSWGLVVNEAMASGLPVLVSRTVGCRYDLVEDGANGLLFDPFDVADIARAMREMSDRSDDQRAAMGRRSAEIIAEWGPERFAEGLWNAVQAANRKT